MAGLLGAMFSGGAQGFAAGTQQNTNAAQSMNLAQLQAEVKMMMEDRVRENARNQNIADAKAVESGAKGLLNARVESQAESVSNTPGASDFVKSEMGASPDQVADYKRDTAMSIGRADLAKDYEAQGTGLRNDRKEENRHQEAGRRADVTEEGNNKRFQAQMAQSERAIKSAEKNAGKVQDAAEIKFFKETMDGIKDNLSVIGAQLKITPDDAELQAKFAKLQEMHDRGLTVSAEKAGIPASKKPGIDDLFPKKSGVTGKY